MPLFRVHRMKESARQSFRWAPHVSGLATVKPKDFELGEEIEAGHEYAAWKAMQESAKPLEVGDLLETPAGDLRICKYVGFESAAWVIPEPVGQPG